MRQIASILLLGMLLFNWFGYRFVSDYLQHDAADKMEARLDKNDYDPSQLIEIRIPLNLPYRNDWSGFERYDGEVDIHGVHYRYVKRKVENGDLVLLCLPDKSKTRLENARNEFFKLVNDLQQNANGSKSTEAGNTGAFKNFMTNYWEQPGSWRMRAPEKVFDNPRSYNTALYHCWYNDTPIKPPKATAFFSC